MSNIFQTYLKGFKLKKLVIEPKTAQLVEPDEESVDPQFNRSKSAKKTLSLFHNDCSTDQG